MENYNREVFKLELDEVAQNHLYETARWGKFLAILGFIFLGLIVLMGVFAGAVFSMLGESNPALAGFSTIGFLLLYIVIAAIYFYPIYALYKFSTKSKVAMHTHNQEQLNEALSYLKGMFKYIGVIAIIFLAIYGLMFVIGIATAGLSSI